MTGMRAAGKPEVPVEEHVARGGRDRGVLRIPWLGRGRGRVRLVAPVDRVDRVVDGGMDHRQVHGRDRALACARDGRWSDRARRLQCRGGGRVPVGDGVRARRNGEREHGVQGEHAEGRQGEQQTPAPHQAH